MNFPTKKIILYGILIIVILTLISLVAAIWLNVVHAFSAVFGIFFVLLVPGYFWTFVIFDETGLLERIGFSIALSITFIPLTMYVASKLGIKPSPISIVIEIIAIVLTAILILFIKKSIKK